MIPDDVEKIIMTKEDYDRNVEQLLYDKINAEQEVERLNNIIDKKEQFLGDNIKRLEREVIKRDNIINELEKWLDKKEKLTFNSWNKGIHEVQRKLQELKGSDKE